MNEESCLAFLRKSKFPIICPTERESLEFIMKLFSFTGGIVGRNSVVFWITWRVFGPFTSIYCGFLITIIKHLLPDYSVQHFLWIKGFSISSEMFQRSKTVPCVLFHFLGTFLTFLVQFFIAIKNFNILYW